MLADDRVEFYNNIYRKNPAKWAADVIRDELAFFLLNRSVKTPGSVMDIGCGNGHTLEYLHSKWPEARYTGVDISDVALDIAKRRLPDGWYYSEIPDGAWDIIIIMGVAEHFDNPSEQLRLIGEKLSPDGVIYLEAPNCIAYSPDKTEGFRKTYAGSDQSEWHWRRNTWKRAILDAGLEIVKSYIGFNPAWEFIWVLRNERKL